MPGNIFFALRGEKFNANQFAEAALLSGASYAVVDEIAEMDWKAKYGEQLIVVENVLHALQQLAGYHRQQFTFPVLAITGSNGKTTTKELVAAVLSKKYKTAFTKGNLNNHIGIPLTLLSIDKEDTEFAIIEMGANHQKEIESYCQYVQPDYGLITNVGLAHIEGFGGLHGVVKGKTELYRHLSLHEGKLFINADDEILMNRAEEFFGDELFDRAILYGTATGVFCSGRPIPDGEYLALQTLNTTIHTQLVGEYNFTNVLSAVCIGKYFHVSTGDIKEAIESYSPVNYRSQKMMWGTNTVIMDAYNANPSSMKAALTNFAQMPGEFDNRLVILGEMMELGEFSKDEHHQVFEQTKHIALDYKVFVGGQFAFTKNEPGTLWFAHTADARKWLHSKAFSKSLILVKGSRANGLEKLF
jgi:UDP-N-acetylmuramoyl-tripeptide--D-alanyl-D-alanine ligase